MKDRKETLNFVQGCLMGIAIGDALGMPVETMWHDDIMQLNEGQGVTGFMPVVQKRIWDTASLKPGDTTDDWQLTRAVANSLIRTKGSLDISDCANEHIYELNNSAFGWGKGSQSAIEAIRDGKRDPKKDLVQSAEPGKGCGNGVIMKIAPLAIANSFTKDRKNLWHECRLLGSLTHPDIQASIAAFAVASFMQRIIRDRYNINFVKGFHPTFESVFTDVKVVERMENRNFIPDNVTRRLRLLDNALDSADTLRSITGCGFSALDTVAFSIGTFLRHPRDFRAGVLEAVNAGGDSDTNASIVGALIGLNCGLSAIPKEWQDYNPQFQEALEIGEKLNSL